MSSLCPCCIGSTWRKLLFRLLLLLFGRVLFVSFSVGEGLCIAQQWCCFSSFPCTVHVCCLSLCYSGISVSREFFCNGLPNCTAWCCCFCVCCKWKWNRWMWWCWLRWFLDFFFFLDMLMKMMMVYMNVMMKKYRKEDEERKN